ncbi:vacuolar protein sorting-associated protein 37B-like [Tropilaelaps mercedesae]|uniref:Vacuolar protein sorting-associated protein 37B-like n=1 Tax=Tropilaelaps mercedesae TaxID=418985 RepID=A0A1V9X030_9ACAR|nr:vacuolar protein sorting-associated protein 37B-like [Tropilaelaps mercedesae]
MTYRLADSQLRNELAGLIHNFQEMSKDELTCLIECEDATLDRQFIDGPAARAMERSRNQLIEENRRIARENVEKETRFFELRNQLLQMYHEGKQLKLNVEKLQEDAPQASTAPPSLDTIQALLEAAARETEDVSESIANDFLSSTISAEEFLAKFIDSRKDSHLRRVRAEKAAELLREQNRVPTAVPSFPRYVPPSGEYQPPSLPTVGPQYGPPQQALPYLPYPTAYPPGGPMSMPTPGS